MKVFCGIDWAENHHDVALVDERGQLVAKCRINDDAAGLATLLKLLAEHGDSAAELIPVAIETSRGLLVASLRATGRPMYAINPLAVSRYRERHTVARAKSDHADAVVLANILRTDTDAHRLLPSDSELVQAIAVLARGGQDAVWNRQQIGNQLRSLLREYFPTAIEAFKESRSGLAAAEARTILAAAPTPALAANLTKARLRRLLIAAGRQRNIDARVDQLHTAFAGEQMRQLPRVEAAFGEQARALILQLDAACRAADHLAGATEEVFTEHPDAAILTSFPGVGTLTGARILAEICDDRSRFTEARNLRPTPARLRSPEPAARASWSCNAGLRISVWAPPDTSGHSQRLPLRATGSAYAGPTTRDVRFRSVNPAPKWPRQPSRFDRVCFDGGQLWHDSTARTGGLRATLARYLTDAQEKNADIQVCALPMSDCILNLLEQSHTIDQLVIVGSSP